MSIEALVVALVQTDRRLVEHVQHADEPAPDLRREADPLRLAAGERARRTVEVEVVEADVEQEAEPLVDLLQHALGDHQVAFGQLERCRGTPRVRAIDISPSSLMLIPPTLTASDDGLSRAPWHAGHGTSRM